MLTNFFNTLSLNTRSILAITITFLSFGFLFMVSFHVIPVQNQNIVNTAAGFILGVLSTVATYFFGSSKDKSDMDKASIAKDAASTQIQVTK